MDRREGLSVAPPRPFVFAGEKIEIVYSYWDGSGHRRTILVPKGVTVGQFLEWVRVDLLKDFPEMKTTAAEDLMYIKEDLIIPTVRDPTHLRVQERD